VLATALVVLLIYRNTLEMHELHEVPLQLHVRTSVNRVVMTLPQKRDPSLRTRHPSSSRKTGD